MNYTGTSWTFRNEWGYQGDWERLPTPDAFSIFLDFYRVMSQGGFSREDEATVGGMPPVRYPFSAEASSLMLAHGEGGRQ